MAQEEGTAMGGQKQIVEACFALPAGGFDTMRLIEKAYERRPGLAQSSFSLANLLFHIRLLQFADTAGVSGAQ